MEKKAGTVLQPDGLVLRGTERKEGPQAWEGLTRGGGTRLWPLGEEGCNQAMQSPMEANFSLIEKDLPSVRALPETMPPSKPSALEEFGWEPLWPA